MVLCDQVDVERRGLHVVLSNLHVVDALHVPVARGKLVVDTKHARVYRVAKHVVRRNTREEGLLHRCRQVRACVCVWGGDATAGAQMTGGTARNGREAHERA